MLQTKHNSKMWKGETAFRIKKGTATPETLQQQFAAKTLPKSTPQRVTLDMQWQVHIAHILTVALELARCATESNVYRSKDCQVYIMICVDDLLSTGVQSIIDTLFSRILRHTSDLNVGSTRHFLGTNISHKATTLTSA